VWFADGRPSQYVHGDDNPGRASITRKMDQSQTKEAARALARAERAKLGALDSETHPFMEAKDEAANTHHRHTCPYCLGNTSEVPNLFPPARFCFHSCHHPADCSVAASLRSETRRPDLADNATAKREAQSSARTEQRLLDACRAYEKASPPRRMRGSP
jgi:hypothetical protein